MRTARSAGLALLAGLVMAGCSAIGIRPAHETVPTQIAQEIPEDERLDVVVHVFDPGIPSSLAADEQALANRRIFPAIRRAEARYFAVMLRNTLEGTSQWGAVRVAPIDIRFVDVAVSGRIVESSGARLVLVVSAHDATGRVWLDNRRYVSEPDPGSYTRGTAPDAPDPFHHMYSRISNDLLKARGKLGATRLREVRQVAELRFAENLAPEASSGYLRKDDSSGPALLSRAAEPGPRSGRVRNDGSSRRDSLRVTRLPARDDPLTERIHSIREHDMRMIDTLDSYYTSLQEQMQRPYTEFRRNFHEIELEERGSQVGPRPAPTDFVTRLPRTVRHRPMDSSYMKAYFDRVAAVSARAYAFAMHLDSFRADADSRVVNVEARSKMLARTTEETYSELRWLLKEYQGEDLALPASTPEDSDR